MYKKLKTYIPVPVENYKDIPLGVDVKYISEEGKYRENRLSLFSLRKTKTPMSFWIPKGMHSQSMISLEVIFMRKIDHSP